MKRRKLLKIASGSLALAGIGLTTGAAAQEGASDAAWSRDRADSLLGQSFWLMHPQAGALALTLAKVVVPEHKTPDPRIDQFSLVFHGPLQPAIADGTYDLDHPAFGRFSLHMTPAGRSGGNQLYRADFSLLR